MWKWSAVFKIYFILTVVLVFAAVSTGWVSIPVEEEGGQVLFVWRRTDRSDILRQIILSHSWWLIVREWSLWCVSLQRWQRKGAYYCDRVIVWRADGDGAFWGAWHCQGADFSCRGAEGWVRFWRLIIWWWNDPSTWCRCIRLIFHIRWLCGRWCWSDGSVIKPSYSPHRFIVLRSSLRESQSHATTCRSPQFTGVTSVAGQVCYLSIIKKRNGLFSSSNQE